MKLLNKIKNFLNKLRSIKDKFTIDNYFDGFFGGLLSCIALIVYYHVHTPLILILLFSPIISSINELLNMLSGEKSFGWKDVIWRSVIGVIIYVILVLK